jgi:CPA2 family monovalent cation:H+ antiporter-2
VPPVLLAGDGASDVLLSLLVILVSAATAALVMQRFRFAIIPVYLMTGACIGPHALRLIEDPGSLTGISRFAIILLLFGIGLDLHLSALRHGLLRMILIGVASCGVTVLAGWPLALAFGMDTPAAITVAMGFSLSSTAMVLRILSEQRALRQPHGRISLSVLVVQDLLVIVMLGALPMIAGPEPGAADVVAPSGWVAVMTSLLRLVGIFLLVLVGRFTLPRLMRESLRGRSLELLMLVGVAAALGAAQLAHMLGFSLEMGAFLAGFTLAGTPFRHQLSGQIGPLRDLFIAVFFTTLGMAVNPTIVLEYWWVVLLGLLFVLALKCLVLAGTCWLLGNTAAVSLAVGLSLAQAGEFSLVLFHSAAGQAILTDTHSAVAIAVVVLSLAVTPLLIRVAGWSSGKMTGGNVAPWVGRSRSPAPHAELPSDGRHIILAGFGPSARLIADQLEARGCTFSIIELNPVTVRDQARQGRTIVFGDVGSTGVLESAGIDRADLLVLTVPDNRAISRACAAARHRSRSLPIVARCGSAAEITSIRNLGADRVVADELAAGAALWQEVEIALTEQAATRDGAESG